MNFILKPKATAGARETYTKNRANRKTVRCSAEDAVPENSRAHFGPPPNGDKTKTAGGGGRENQKSAAFFCFSKPSSLKLLKSLILKMTTTNKNRI